MAAETENDQIEEARLAALRRYEILDTPPDLAFDRITMLAARLFRVPIAIISIVDRDRIWFKSHHGIDLNETGREPGLCDSVIERQDALVISDATLDPTVHANSLVAGHLGLQFYAAVPLTSPDGFTLGALCIIDTSPRELGDGELATLHDLAAIVMDELEVRLSARSEEERLEQIRSQFTATVSHELKTPLAAVYGAAMTLTRDDDAISDDTRRRLLAVISEQGERLRDMFETLLTTSQLESGRFQLATSELDPAEIIRTAAEAARIHLPENLSITVSAAGEPPTIRADGPRVRQVIDNLLDNAIKYSPAGGEIHLGVEAAAGTVRFTVRDEGIGIPAEERDHIFERFHRLDPEQRNGVAGSGLGLYVVRQLATRMGGQINLESSPQKGSTFTLELPLRPPPDTGIRHPRG